MRKWGVRERVGEVGGARDEGRKCEGGGGWAGRERGRWGKRVKGVGGREETGRERELGKWAGE